MSRLIQKAVWLAVVFISPALLPAQETTGTTTGVAVLGPAGAEGLQKQDFTIRGLDTYTTHIVFPKGLTAAEAFEKLAKDYHFRIEWDDDDSTEAEAVKGKIQDKTYHAGGLVRTAVERSYPSLFEKQIVSPRLVRISVKESAKAKVRSKSEQERVH